MKAFNPILPIQLIPKFNKAACTEEISKTLKKKAFGQIQRPQIS
jgi:hypothetical protein